MDQALPINLVPFDPTIAQKDISLLTADEYLSWVRFEAEQLPGVIRANLDSFATSHRQSKYMPEVEEIQKCPIELLPDESWERDAIYAFSSLRSKLVDLSLLPNARERKVTVPAMKDRNAWKAFCYGKGIESEVLQLDESLNKEIITVSNGELLPEEFELKTKKRELKMAIGLYEDHLFNHRGTCEDKEGDITTKQLNTEVEDASYMMKINHEDNEDGFSETNDDECNDFNPVQKYPAWNGLTNVAPTTSILLQLDQVLAQKLLVYHVDWLTDNSLSFSSQMAQWIYSLLARIEKPLYRDVAATVRQLYRLSCTLRFNFPIKTNMIISEQDEAMAEAVDQSTLAALNMIISICGSYFGQGEEYDHFNYRLYNEMESNQDGKDSAVLVHEEGVAIKRMKLVDNRETFHISDFQSGNDFEDETAEGDDDENDRIDEAATSRSHHEGRNGHHDPIIEDGEVMEVDNDDDEDVI